jgi:TRAP-type C4-dicarboxylate transport system substrate-binding protein
MNKHGTLGALTALAIFTMPAAAADYRFLTSWDVNNPAVPLLAEAYAKNVQQASKGAINFIRSGPETVPPFEQLQPVAAGAFHLLFTHGIYHYGTTGISVALDALTGTIEQRRASGVFALLDQQYQKLGLKVVAVAISAKTGYTFQVKSAVGPDGDFKGKKIRGTPSYHPVIRLLNGAPVVLPIPEVYSALEKGVIDGAASPVVGLLGVKWYEVAKFVTEPSFGYTHQILLMNLGTWNRFSDADKKILLDAGRKMEETWYAEYDKLAANEIKELVSKGVTLTKLSPSKEKLDATWGEGLWGLALKKSPNEAKALHALAKEKKLSN